MSGSSGVAGAAGSSGGSLCAKGALTVSSFRDLGESPAGTAALSVAVVGDAVLVGTEHGVLRKSLDGSGDYEATALGDFPVVALRVVPGTGTVLAGITDVFGSGPTSPPIRRSIDGGKTWETFGEGFDDPAADPKAYDPVSDFAFRAGVIYANASGNAIAESTDDGKTWHYDIGGPGMFSYPCVIGFSSALGKLVQGCEAPLDFAAIRAYTPTAGDLEDPPAVLLDTDVLGNRRPNVIVESAADPAAIYAGVEGGLVRITAEGTTWVFQKAEEDTGPLRYTYVRTVWVDPCDANHLVFAGMENGNNDVLQIYETFDRGGKIDYVTTPAVGAGPYTVRAGAIASAGGEHFLFALTLGADATQRVRLLVREHQKAP
jgi:hypothetical protein